MFPTKLCLSRLPQLLNPVGMSAKTFALLKIFPNLIYLMRGQLDCIVWGPGREIVVMWYGHKTVAFV